MELEAFAANIEAGHNRHDELKTMLAKRQSGSENSPSDGPPYYIIPFPRNVRFRGRQESLSTLHNVLDPMQTTKVPRSLTVCGIGGVGKTQTALEYVYAHQSEYLAIFWAPADTLLKLNHAFASFAVVLGLQDDERTSNTDVVREFVKRWLSTTGMSVETGLSFHIRKEITRY